MTAKGLLTDSMVRCLREMTRHGYAERVQISTRFGHWKWQIGGQDEPKQQVDIGMRKGLFVLKRSEGKPDRAVMTDLGRRCAAEASRLAA